MGIRDTLSILSPFLQPPRQNLHATFITLFINAVKEAIKMGDSADEMPDIETLIKYLPAPRLFPPPSTNNADMTRIWDARSLALDVNKYFKR